MIRCISCGKPSPYPGDVVPGIADWFCCQSCFEEYRDAQRAAKALGRVLPFTKPAKPAERFSER